MTLKVANVALTGLRAAASRLATTANNVANASTSGFKRSEVNFGDLFTEGGTVGKGVTVTNVSQQFIQGSITNTDNIMDLSITGDGFFRLNDKGTTVYSRAGNFNVDRDGFIVNGMGQKLTGFPTDATGELTAGLADIRVDEANTPPKATTFIDISMNLNAASEPPREFNINDPQSYNYAARMPVIDSLGNSHLTNIYFRKEGAENTWKAHTFVGDQEISPAGGDLYEFDTLGQLTDINGTGDTVVTQASFIPGPGTEPMVLTFDLAKTTQYEETTGVNELTQDGFAAGRLTGVQVDESGTIFGRYTNEQLATLGQITLTKFRSPQGLSQMGNTSWVETLASGESITDVPGNSSLGFINPGTLEDSNVDITEELVSMIGTQRSYQANSQVISVADQMTQTIMNIRR